MTEILIALFGCEGGKQRRCVVLPTKLCTTRKQEGIPMSNADYVQKSMYLTSYQTDELCQDFQ